MVTNFNEYLDIKDFYVKFDNIEDEIKKIQIIELIKNYIHIFAKTNLM